MLMMLMQSDFLRWFAGSLESEVEEETAWSWVVTAIVVALVLAGLSFGYKAFRKAAAPNLDKKIWTRGETWLSFFVGLFPVFILMTAIWYLTVDYFEFIRFAGLLKGILFAWFLYLLAMIVGHLVSPWRRELI